MRAARWKRLRNCGELAELKGRVVNDENDGTGSCHRDHDQMKGTCSGKSLALSL
jgi:hypothetical protein